MVATELIQVKISIEEKQIEGAAAANGFSKKIKI